MFQDYEYSKYGMVLKGNTSQIVRHGQAIKTFQMLMKADFKLKSVITNRE